MRYCDIDGCDGEHLAKGMCRKHYLRMYKTGSLDIKVPRGSAVSRIMSKVTIQQNECWLFTGTLTPKGYGLIAVGGRMRSVHIVMYEEKYGPVPDGLELDHFKCDCRACCNPDHVKPTTHADNIKRAVAKYGSRWGFGRLSAEQRRAQARRAILARWEKELI